MSKETENTQANAPDDDHGDTQPDHGAASVFDWETGQITPGPMVQGADPFEIARYRAARRTREEARHIHTDTTIAGGAFLTADGSLVDANGNPIEATIDEVEAEIDAIRSALPPRPM